MRAGPKKYLLLIVLVVILDGACRKSQDAPFFSHNSSPNPSSSNSKSPSLAPGFSGPVLVGHPVKLSDLSDTEIRFGRAPKRGPGLTYQDDIILMEEGDKAIQSFASNGMSWTLDANSPQVSDIQEGKILFATERCVGKVLAVQRNAGSVTVVLGPVQLNELVKEGNFSYDQPFDLNNAIAVVAPDYPGAVGSKELQQQAQQPSQTSGSITPHGYRRAVSYYTVSNTGKWTPMRTVTAGGPKLVETAYHPDAPLITPAAFQAEQILGGAANSALGNAASAIPLPKLPKLNFNNLQAYPCALDCGGIGAKLYQEKDGVKVWVSIVFHLNNPHLLFSAWISGGRVNANLQLFGGAGVTVTVDGATGGDFKSVEANIKEIGLIPAEINVPIGGVFIPLTAKLIESLDIATGFSAKTSVLHGEGSLDLDGEISASYTNQGWNLSKPTATVSNNLAGMISGVSMGINSFVFGFNQRLMVGVGALGFAAGPYVDLLTSLTTLKQSSATWYDCRQATFALQLGAGIGYSMPKVVAKVINAVLGLFGAKPIPSTGSIVGLPKPVELWSKIYTVPANCSGGGK
jgi:hypothetical protein